MMNDYYVIASTFRPKSFFAVVDFHIDLKLTIENHQALKFQGAS